MTAPPPLSEVFKDFDNNATEWLKQHDAAIRNATISDLYDRIKAERDPSLEYVDWDSIEAVFIRTREKRTKTLKRKA